MLVTRSSLPPRGLLALIAGVTVIPLATLFWLGWRLLEQDRILEMQQAEQQINLSADLIVSALDRAMASSEQQLATQGTDWPEGAVALTVRADALDVQPPGRVAFLPVVPLLPEPPSSVFAAADDTEFRLGDVPGAMARFEALSRSPAVAIRAGALLRLARAQERSGQTEHALASYELLAAIDNVRIADAPASLVARYARCRVFESRKRTTDLASEARRLLDDLHRGRWPLTAAVYWLYSADAVRWSGAPADAAARQKELLAEVVAALWEQRHGRLPTTGRPASGRETILVGDQTYVVLWQSSRDALRALVAAPDFVARQWVTAADSVALERKVTFSLAATHTTPDRVTAAVGQTSSIVRSALQTDLPWDVAVARANSSPALSGFAARRRLLIAGFLLLVCLALTASYLIVRAVSREMAVARLQSDFVAAVSHEFRTPLTTLRQFTDMLREHEVLTDERRRVCYDAQSRATSRLTRLVESLLDFGRMEAGAQPYALEPRDCTTLVRSVVDDFRVDAQAAGYAVRFRGNGGAPIQADPDALSRAIWNLLDNAVKYSPGRSAIDVAVHREDSDVTIAVTDRGIGIPADERSFIFAKFQRGIEARSLGIKGTGLGLTMVDEIVRAHHGRVEVESEPGEGSTFRIHLPVAGDA